MLLREAMASLTRSNLGHTRSLRWLNLAVRMLHQLLQATPKQYRMGNSFSFWFWSLRSSTPLSSLAFRSRTHAQGATSSSGAIERCLSLIEIRTVTPMT